MRLTKKLVRAIVWKALATFGGKKIERGDLVDGKSHQVNLVVSGTIDGVDVVEKLAGTLDVNAGATQTENKKPGADHLVALILAQLSPQMRKKTIAATLAEAERLEKVVAGKIEAARADKQPTDKVGNLHAEVAAAVKGERLDEAARLVKRFTLAGSKWKNGSLAFTPST
ncbi:MAG: hypothetical protein ACIALR_16540 [Blastopirellula sp. JB062]